MKTKKGFVLRNVCGENIIVAEGKENIDFTKIISMNETAAYLWKNVEGKEFDSDTLMSLLINEYEVDDATANKDAKNIAKHIVQARQNERIHTTGQLVEIIKAAIPMKFRATGGHPAKRTFQALRIELNKELEVLENSIDEMIELLNDGGRLCIITFHSLEDRIVKNKFRDNVNTCTCPPEFPVCVCGNKPKGVIVTRKPIVPSEEELEENKRAKSSKLRIFERRL